MGSPPSSFSPENSTTPFADRATSLSPPTLPSQLRQQRKGGGTKAWAVVDSSGWSRVDEFGKHAIMQRTGLPARDLRILDPALSYPSTILGRERAIVVKLEYIKAIITANEVLALHSTDPHMASFVRDLEMRVASSPIGVAEKAQENSQRDMEVVDIPSARFISDDVVAQDHHQNLVVNESAWPKCEVTKAGVTKVVPFEFRALEACLECACRCLESEASTLEKEAYPALDELTSKISTLNLERVRQIKSRLVAISGRVQKVRDELEHLLDDDMDMAEMYLTSKLHRQQLDDTSSMDEIDGDEIEREDERDHNSTNKTESCHSSGELTFAPNIEELEMLLEAYFVQIEGTLNKLSALTEYVDDTEDYINIMLDDKQNQLLQMGVMLSTATMVTSAAIAVVGVFGMNIHISLYDSEPAKFWETVSVTTISCVFLFITAIVWGKRKGLLS